MDKNNQHTPGNWFVWSRETELDPATATARPLICSSYGDGAVDICIVNDEGVKEWATNARLIAAAPDLYSALERLVNCPDVNLDELEPGTRKAVRQARAALEKVNQ